MMYDPNIDERTPNGREKPWAVFPAMTKTDPAMAYAKDAFKRLTGYPAEERRARGTGAGGAMAYAEDVFARMRGDRPDHPYDFAYHLHRHPARDDHVVRGGRMAGMQADRAMAYARDMFRRLRGLPAQEPLGPEHRQDKVRQHRRQRSGRPGGCLRNNGRRDPYTMSIAKTWSSFARKVLLISTAIGRAMMLLIRGSILEPYALRRRRRIAIAQLKALDDRLLADIGVQRNDIERTVDGMLARRDDPVSPRAAPALPAEDGWHDRRHAA